MMGEYTGMDRFVGTSYVQEAARIKLTQNLGNPPPLTDRFAVGKSIQLATQ